MLIRRKATHTAKFNFLDIIPSVAMDAIPSPRIFATHLRFHQLPEQFRQNRSKLIYCVRNPKDVAVSLYTFSRANRDIHYTGTWEQFLKDFQKGNGRWVVFIRYSRLSSSRLRLSRTTAYLEQKIWSMFKSNIR